MPTLQLNQQNLPTLSNRIPAPKYDRSAITTGIVHIGVGGFHRAHQAYYLHQLLSQGGHWDWGICGIGLREGDRRIAGVLDDQDGMYTLIAQHPDGRESPEVIGSIVEYILAVEDPERAVAKMADPTTKIVSLTITEGGYNLNSSTGEFNFDNPAVQRELASPNDPQTVFGYLSAALKRRRSAGLPAFTVMSCDNIEHNGDVARKILLAFLGRQDPELYEWVEREVQFPNSMVDRITPVTPPAAGEMLKTKYQLLDDWPVVCEPYLQWVIEDKFSNGRPPLEEVGVQVVPDVTPYETMKIRLLNAGHSVLGIPGAVHGHATINDCMADPVFATFLRRFMDEEVTPLLGGIPGVDLTAYKDTLEERFANPNIRDGVSRICSESSAKLPKFLLPTIRENLAAGGSIKFGTFVLAAWAYYHDRRISLGGRPLEIIDTHHAMVHQYARQYERDALSFLRIPEIFGELSGDERFTEQYLKVIASIYDGHDIRGIMATISH